MSRREALGLVKFFGVGAVVVAGGGWYFVSKVVAGIAESDLSKIGNGIPTIVQVHDPQCPSCLALQRETRRALEHIDAERLQYLVASLHTPEGRKFASTHGAGRVTLLLVDGAGRVRDVIRGERSEAALLTAFERHLNRYGSTSGDTG